MRFSGALARVAILVLALSLVCFFGAVFGPGAWGWRLVSVGYVLLSAGLWLLIRAKQALDAERRSYAALLDYADWDAKQTLALFQRREDTP